MKYPIGVHILPKRLDEKVARLQLGKLGGGAHRADRRAGGVHRRVEAGALQGRALPVLGRRDAPRARIGAPGEGRRAVEILLGRPRCFLSESLERLSRQSQQLASPGTAPPAFSRDDASGRGVDGAAGCHALDITRAARSLAPRRFTVASAFPGTRPHSESGPATPMLGRPKQAVAVSTWSLGSTSSPRDRAWPWGTIAFMTPERVQSWARSGPTDGRRP
jgi:hypothetical protein